jgi:hypothetical protein
MAKEKKVHIRDTPKYTSSSDEESSDDEVDYFELFKGLDRAKVEKINEFVSVQKSLALAIKRNEMLSSELSTCHESVSSLKNLNDELNAKLEKTNATRSCVEL